MCRYRRVNIYYTGCGHSVPQPDEIIPCDDTRCIFSSKHGTSCPTATCKQTCWQRFQYPQMYSPNINSPCPRCSQGS